MQDERERALLTTLYRHWLGLSGLAPSLAASRA
jgi:hypothetical protein